MDADRIELMRGMPVFGGLGESALEWILEHAPERSVSAGDYFFKAGEPAESLFVLESGRAAVFLERVKGPCQLAVLGPGDCFGEMALIDFGPRSASVRALEDCLALEIPQGQIHALYQRDLKQFTLVQMNLARELSRRLRRADALAQENRGDLPPDHRYST